MGPDVLGNAKAPKHRAISVPLGPNVLMKIFTRVIKETKPNVI